MRSARHLARLAGVAAVAAAPGSALAQSTPTPLSGSPPVTLASAPAATPTATARASSAPTARAASAELAETGAEPGLVALTGLGLLACGLGVRRVRFAAR